MRVKLLLALPIILAVSLAVTALTKTRPEHSYSVDLSSYHESVLLNAEAGEMLAQVKMGEWLLDGSFGVKDKFEAREWFRLAAEQGHAGAQFTLADQIVAVFPYTEGDASDEALAESNRWLRLAAEQGHVEAAKALGYRYWLGEGVVKDDAEAANWMEQAAREGDRSAQSFLADAYARGEGVPHDPIKAAFWNRKVAAQIRKAAELGDQYAQLALGIAYAGGDDLPQDDSQAVRWLTLAAEGDFGLNEAKLLLARLLLHGNHAVQDKVRAVSLYLELAEASPQAQHELAMAYILGEATPPEMDWRLDAARHENTIKLLLNPHAPSSMQKAADIGRDLLVKSAKAGYAPAQLELGLMIMKGAAWEANPAMAVSWLQAAADQGLADAQYALGYAYGTGQGVDRDDKAAFRLLSAAADQGHMNAQLAVAWHAYNGTGTVQDSAVAVSWFRRGALQGNPLAQRFLAEHYVSGDGVPLDNIKAHMWINIALSNSHPDKEDLREDLDALSASLSPDELTKAQAMATACVASNYTSCEEHGQAD